MWQRAALVLLALSVLLSGAPAFAADEITKSEMNELSFYKDIFDQNVYSEGMNQLDLGRWGRKLFRKEVPSANVNVFDEVPDSAFFTNRHARQRLSIAELEKGVRETEGPDTAQPLTVIGIEQRGLNYGFIIEDSKKDRYLLRFDLNGSMEMTTGAEVAASRFYHAIGYNVPQYTVLFLKPEQLKIAPDAITCDNTGFVKKLTPESLHRYFSSMPQTSNGSYRASASKIPPGKEMGGFSFWSRRKEDPQDPINHRDRREIRALGIFASWLNDYGLCESNTLDTYVTENGRSFFKHYLADFTNAFGASTDGAKPAVYGHEYMMDFGEAFKSFLMLGLREKPWQKKWAEDGEKSHTLQSVGYFSNKYFDPAKYKVQLPYEAFRMVTPADGFWAAKIIACFSDADIAAAVKAAQYSDPKAAEYITKTLVERRDKIAGYWFKRVNPLDGFSVEGSRLTFKDLAMAHDLEPKSGTVYHVEVLPAAEGSKVLETFSVSETVIPLKQEWLSMTGGSRILIRTFRPASSKSSAPVTIFLGAAGITGIRHAR